MITAGDFRKGVTFVLDGAVYYIVDFQHVKPGKGAAFVRTKIKNAMTGQVLERTFNPSEKFELAHIEHKEMQYLYADGDLYYFMDTQTYEQFPFNKETVADALNFIIEGMNVQVQLYNGKAFAVDPPLFVELKVTECEPAVQGDTSKSAMKVAKLETGLEIKVPLFVAEGDTVRVDTRTAEYMERI